MAEIYTAHVQNGVIVLDEGAPQLPEGAKVKVELQSEHSPATESNPLLELIELFDSMPSDPNWPEDAAAQHDHYLYGAKKRP